MLVDRRRPDRTRIFAWASRLTSYGLSLIVFPEGTRSRDGRVARFKGGSFYLALEAGLPIVPISVVGSRHVMLKGRLATYPGDVKLVVHEPIDTAGMADADPREFAERVRRIIRADSRVGCRAAPTVPGADAASPRRRQRTQLMPPFDSISVAPKLVSIVRAGVLWLDDATVVEREPRLNAPLAAAEAAVRTNPPVEVTSVRTMYKRVGLDPTKTRPSSEALLRRVAQGRHAAAHQQHGGRVQLVLARVPAAVWLVRRGQDRRRRGASSRC